MIRIQDEVIQVHCVMLLLPSRDWMLVSKAVGTPNINPSTPIITPLFGKSKSKTFSLLLVKIFFLQAYIFSCSRTIGVYFAVFWIGRFSVLPQKPYPDLSGRKKQGPACNVSLSTKLCWRHSSRHLCVICWSAAKSFSGPQCTYLVEHCPGRLFREWFHWEAKTSGCGMFPESLSLFVALWDPQGHQNLSCYKFGLWKPDGSSPLMYTWLTEGRGKVLYLNLML